MSSEVVEQKFLGGWIACSYLISLLGAFTTLVVLRERTASRGRRNWLLLTGAALAMGGISIFSMHFIGNRAVILLGQKQQLYYSGGIVGASFILPVVIVFLAFVVAGAIETGKGRWPALLLGGTLAGCGVVGMHYCGQTAISNYYVYFRPGYVAGSVIIALFATNFALALFFVLRNHWEDSWLRLAGCAVLLSGAVTSMHYTAACGTVYYAKSSQLSSHTHRQASLILFVIIVSIVTCLALLAYIAYGIARTAGQRARAQKVILACAVFDSLGNIMVHGSDGTLPTQMITDTYIEFSVADTLDSSNAAFHWMYKVSMHWDLIIPMMDKIRKHLAVTTEFGLTQDLSRQTFSIRLRELFCTAAQSLADRIGTSLSGVGVCYDKIVKTGNAGNSPHRGPLRRFSKDFEAGLDSEQYPRTIEKQGRTMILVKHIELQSCEDYTRRGFRFAPLQSVASNIASALDLSREEALNELYSMQQYDPSRAAWTPGLHVACFGVRAQVLGGFNILVETQNNQLLPATQVQEEPLDDESLDFLSRHYGLTFRELAMSCASMVEEAECENGNRIPPFFTRLHSAIQRLGLRMGDASFDEARFIPRIALVPCQGQYKGSTARLLLFRFSVPIHVTKTNPDLEWVSFNMFNAMQVINSDDGVNAFTRDLYHEFNPLFQQMAELKSSSSSPKSPGLNRGFDGIMVQQDNEIRVDEAEKMSSVQMRSQDLNQRQYKAAFLATGGGKDVGTWSEQALRLDNSGWRF